MSYPSEPPTQPFSHAPTPSHGGSGRNPLLVGLVAALLIVAVAVVAVVALTLGGGDDASQDAVATSPPTQVRLDISSPSTGRHVKGDRITVRGTVQPTNATVLVHGRDAPVGNGVFTMSVSLHAGTNRIDVIGSAEGATPVERTVTVVRASAPRATPRTVVVPAAPAARPAEEDDGDGPAPHVPGTRLEKACDQNITASSTTSCTFAANVFKAYAGARQAGGSSDRVVRAYDDRAGTTTSVDCSYDGATVFCRSGSGQVNFPRWAADVY